MVYDMGYNNIEGIFMIKNIDRWIRLWGISTPNIKMPTTSTGNTYQKLKKILKSRKVLLLQFVAITSVELIIIRLFGG